VKPTEIVRPAGQPPRYQSTKPVMPPPVPTRARGAGFGDKLVNEKTLDEVILSYLAEDLEESES
jgi:hypothetical protein